MELIIAMALFIALVACWIVLPANPEPAREHAHGVEPSAGRTMRA